MLAGELVVGVVQYGAGRRRGESLERFTSLLRRWWRGAGLIVAPEFSDVSPAQSLERLRGLGVGVEDNEFVSGIEKVAGEYSAHLLVGVLERGEDGCLYSSVVHVSPSGGARVVYRKRVLFDALGVRESELLCPGSMGQRGVVNIGGWRVGLLVCFELRFPELARRLTAIEGTEVLAAPSAWYAGPLKEDQFIVMSRARAMENTVYLVAANQYGERFTGRSLVVDPYGVPLLDLGRGEAYGETVVSRERLVEARRLLPLLEIGGRLGLWGGAGFPG